METLYRKYRPHTFKEVVAQEDIVTSLEKSIETGNVAHAYIFAGGRGIGKTSIARIFASALGTSQSDLYEIDAASNRGIDDIRAIKEAVQTLPFQSKYKIYIIDEVHMLTKEAWNALLKTLEEPPAHIVFILATTELEKIPDTILSRCQVFTFKKPNQKTLSNVVSKTAKEEGYKIDEETSEMIALLSDGSFRDAHSVLQKAITFSEDKKLTLENLEKISGAPKVSIANDILHALAHNDASLMLQSIEVLRNENRDLKIILKLIIERVRIAILFRISKPFAEELVKDYAPETKINLLKIAEDKSSIVNSKMLLSLLKTYDSISHSDVPDIVLEASLLRILEDK